jgi:uncharacterized protein YbbK (DUF523 family)
MSGIMKICLVVQYITDDTKTQRCAGMMIKYSSVSVYDGVMEKITKIIKKKKVKRITFYFVEESPGCGSEDIKKECDINWFDFFFFSVFFLRMS